MSAKLTISSPGHLAVRMMEELETRGIRALYLRHYQNLPRDVGNDADILVEEGRCREARAVLIDVATTQGWWMFSSVPFSSESLHFVRNDSLEFIHVDVFVREEWHWLEYADMRLILSRRRFNGLVHHPDAGDEIYLNVINRLIYQGVVREKHRLQVAEHLTSAETPAIRQAFIDHLGVRRGGPMADAVLTMDWPAVESMQRQVMVAALGRYGLVRMNRCLSGLWRYMVRAVARLRKPPGLFIVFEGADGVGKSTVIDGVVPLLEKLTGRNDTLMFHWKPLAGNIRRPGDAIPPPRSPRGKATRGRLASLIFLTYHWLGYWLGWWRRLRPHLVRNGAVVADRYAHDFFLDPARFRLDLSDRVLRLAKMTVPQPDVVVCLMADAALVRRRKPELSVDEIDIYQQRLRTLAAGDQRMLLVQANGLPQDVCEQVRSALLRCLQREKAKD